MSSFEVVAELRDSDVVARQRESVNGLLGTLIFEAGVGLTSVVEVPAVDRLEVRLDVLTDPLVDGGGAVGVLIGLIPREEIRLLGVLVDGGARRRGDDGDCGTIPRDTLLELSVGVSAATGASAG